VFEDNIRNNLEIMKDIVLTHTNAAADEINLRLDNQNILSDRIW
jgi:hypothetical protein